MSPEFIHATYVEKYTYEEIRDVYLSEVKNKRGKRVRSIILPDKSRYRLTNTFRLIMEKGNICSSCKKSGTYFLQTERNNTDKFNVNACIYLFTEDNILMTRDHIIPRSAAGSDRLLNLQPMCSSCNRKKNSDIPNVVIDNLYSFRNIYELVLKKYPKESKLGYQFSDEYKKIMKYRHMSNQPPYMTEDEIDVTLQIINEEYDMSLKPEDLLIKFAPKVAQ